MEHSSCCASCVARFLQMEAWRQQSWRGTACLSVLKTHGTLWIFFLRRKFRNFNTTYKPCLVASCKLAYRIAKQKEPRTTGKTLVKPSVPEMVELMRGLEHTNETEALRVSNYVTHITIDSSSSIFWVGSWGNGQLRHFPSECNWMELLTSVNRTSEMFRPICAHCLHKRITILRALFGQ
jgi:hypothetical protein